MVPRVNGALKLGKCLGQACGACGALHFHNGLEPSGLAILGCQDPHGPINRVWGGGLFKGGLRAILADEAWGGLFGPTHMAGAEPREAIVGSPQKARPQCALLRLRVQVEEYKPQRLLVSK